MASNSKRPRVTGVDESENLARAGCSFTSNSLESNRIQKKLKTSCGLHLRVDEDGRFIVEAIVQGYAADLCGAVALGDMVLAVDGKEMDTLAVDLPESRKINLKGVEGSLVFLSMSRKLNGVKEPFLYDVGLWYGSLGPKQLQNCLEHIVQALQEEQRLGAVLAERVNALKKKVEIESAVNKVLEARIAATKEKILRAEQSVHRGTQEKDKISQSWIAKISGLIDPIKNLMVLD